MTIVTAMPTVTEHVHGDHSDPEQDPDPIVEHPLHFDISYGQNRPGGS
jgi:hypothetical protein